MGETSENNSSSTKSSNSAHNSLSDVSIYVQAVLHRNCILDIFYCE